MPLCAGESIILPQTLGIGTSARVGITRVQGQFIYEDLHVFHACKLGQASKSYLERVQRIELWSFAWKAIALPLSYTRF